MHWLRYARALDDEVVYLAVSGHLRDFADQLGPERAADAAVLHLDDFLQLLVLLAVGASRRDPGLRLAQKSAICGGVANDEGFDVSIAGRVSDVLVMCSGLSILRSS